MEGTNKKKGQEKGDKKKGTEGLNFNPSVPFFPFLIRARYCVAVPEFQGLPPWITPEDRDYYVAQYRKNGFLGPANRYRNVSTNNDITPELEGRRISRPAAFVAGSADDVLLYDPEWRDTFPSGFDDLRFLEMVDGAGHWLQVERPEATTALTLRFLRKID